MCRKCGEAAETAKHVIFDCPALCRRRSSYLEVVQEEGRQQSGNNDTLPEDPGRRHRVLIQEPWTVKSRVMGMSTAKGKLIYDTQCDKPRACIFVNKNIKALKITDLCSRDIAVTEVHLQTALNDQGMYAHGHADDIVILIRGKRMGTCLEIMQRALSIVERWCVTEGLSVNPSKTIMVPFTKQRNAKITRAPILFGNQIEVARGT
nr:unnamed protein product [Callosobruchus chinensis]